MYLDPFVAGVLSTIFAELLAGGVAIVVSIVKLNHKNNEDK